MNFSTLRNEFFIYYGKQKYMAAFKLANKFVPGNSGVETTVTNWKLCAASLAGKPDLVISVFQKAVDGGFFFPASALRGDPDLAAMQDNPEYQRLVAICEQRHRSAQKKAKPVLFTTFPETQTNGSYPLLMAFHGWGQPIDDFSPHWDTLAKQGWLVALAQSSQVVGNGIRVWDNLERSLQEVTKHYRTLVKQHPIDQKRIVLAGFSQGGGLAVWLALTQAIPICGVIGVGPYLDEIDALAPTLPARPIPNVRTYLVSGAEEDDEGMFAKMGALFTEKGIPFHHEIVPGIGHEFPPDFDQTLQRAMDFIFENNKE
jgi:predicted esterase